MLRLNIVVNLSICLDTQPDHNPVRGEFKRVTHMPDSLNVTRMDTTTSLVAARAAPPQGRNDPGAASLTCETCRDCCETHSLDSGGISKYT